VEKHAGHAFISYVREDSHQVDELQRALEATGIRVWRDTADLWPGEDWRAKIRRAIIENTLAFIVCFSSRSVARDKSYQNEELLLAIEQLRLRRPDDPWLIPVRFNDCEVPDFDLGGGRTLSSIQRVDLFGSNRDVGTVRLAAAIMRILGQPFLHLPTGERKTSKSSSRFAAVEEVRRRADQIRRKEAEQAFLVESRGPWGHLDQLTKSNALEVARDSLRKNSPIKSGRNSKVLELNLPSGEYRMSWTTEGAGYFSVRHESGGHGEGTGLVGELSPSSGELVVRLSASGRHIFSVQASRLAWELQFTFL
jgi:hypothetical protein